MTASSADRTLPVLFAIAALAALAPAGVWAQAGSQPVPLAPPIAAEAAGEAPAGSTLVVPSPVLDTQPLRPREPGAGLFEVQELKAPNPEAVGVLDDRQGGLGPNVWTGTPAVLVRRYLPQIPVASGSRVMHALARRLLLTAAAPDGGAGDGPSLIELRAERLFALGEIDGLAALLKVAPAALSSPGLQRLKIDTYLLAGDTKAACAEAAVLAATQGAAADPRLSVFCNLINGKVLEANLALDLMRERKDADHAFIAAAEAMGGTPPAKVDKLPNPLPLHFAAFKAAKMALPADVAANSQPPLLRAIVDNPGLPIDTRLAAAERAESLGALDTDSLRKFYGAVTFSPPEQQAAQAQGDKSPRGRVLLLRAVQAEAVPAARADLIVRIVAAAAERGAQATTARLYAPLIADLHPAPDLAVFAAPLARALFLAGRPEAANTWVTLAKSDPVGAKAAEDLWALARLGRMGGADASPASAFATWRTARDLPAEAAERRLAAGLDLLQAVGDKVPAAEWLALPQSGVVASVSPKPAVKAMLRGAAEGLRVGETLLLALVALGEGGLDKVDPDTLNRVVVDLRMVGLDREARELAIEAALANGV